ncbi:MAG: FAD-dependent oxidoreductase, partial [Devosia sp.]
LDIRRHAAARAGLAPLGLRPEADRAIETCDIAIIGAGPAALSAALTLAEAGRSVILLDERAEPGGQYFKPLAPSHRFAAGTGDRQFARGQALVESVRRAGAIIRSGQMVWHGTVSAEGRPELGIIGPDGAYVLSAEAVLLATGAFERPHHVPGWTLPGVMTAGAGQTLARAYRVSPGQRVLVAGNGPLNWQVALEIARGGGKVVALLEAARPSHPGNLGAIAGMARAAPGLALAGLGMRAQLLAAGIKLHESTMVARLEGRDRLEAVIALDAQGRELAFEADAACLGYGFTPAVELLRQLGGAVDVDAATGYPVPRRDGDGRTSRPKVFIAGDGGGIGGSEAALAQGEIAAAAMLASLSAKAHDPSSARSRLAKAQAFQRSLWQVFAPALSTPAPTRDTMICRCEGIAAGAILDLKAEGVDDLGSLKRRTRLGMGRCQGRYCAGAALKLLRDDIGACVEADLFAPQAPARPVPAIVLATEKAEWGGHREVPLDRIPRGAHIADPLPARCDLLVIGAGITGASTALFAARDGADVLVIDRSAPNSQASGGNAGSLHVQLLSWDFGKKAMAGGSPAQRTLPLQRDSVALWKDLERELNSDFEIVTTGGLMVAENEEQGAFLRDKAAAERACGIDTEVIGRNELATLAPAVSERMLVAAYCAAEGKINPLKGTPAIVAAAEAAGARFASGHQVVAIAPEGDHYRVTTGAGASILTRRVVIASGGWSRQLGAMLGVDLPISGAPLQMLVTEPTRPILKQLIAHADRHLTMKQATNGNLIIGGAWTAGRNPETGYSKVLRTSIEGNLWVAERTVPAMAGLHLLRSWAAMNINIDGAPLLGALPGHPRVFVAATANGYTLGPMMGKLTAALATGRDAGRAIDYFTLARFS